MQEKTPVVFRAATLQDALDIAPRLRKEDLEEVRAATGRHVEEAVVKSYIGSEMCFVACLGDMPIMIFGLSRYNSDVGIPWMLGSDELPRRAKDLLPVSSAVVELFNLLYPVIYNMVDKRNTKSIRWLKWLGFEAIQEFPTYGAEQRPFIQFARYRHV